VGPGSRGKSFGQSGGRGDDRRRGLIGLGATHRVTVPQSTGLPGVLGAAEPVDVVPVRGIAPN